VWDFGDGVQAGGERINHTYTEPGVYTATVTVTDPGGETDTDSVEITVTGTAGQQAPPPTTGQQTQPPPAPQTGAQTESRPLVAAPTSKRVRQVMRRGLRLRVTCVEACRASTVLRLSGERLGGSKAVRIGAGKSRALVVRLDRTVRRNLQAAMRQAGVRRLTTTAVTKIVTAAGTETVRTQVTLRI
jgi:PKD repeat protein